MPVPKVSVLERVDCIFEKMCPKELEEEAHRSKGRLGEHSRQSPSFLGHVLLTASLQIKPSGFGDVNEGRRKCLEISEIPMLPLDSPSNLTQELGQLIGVTVDKQDISIAHRLPGTKSKKDGFIVKFVRREKRDEFTSHASTSLGKKGNVLPSVACEMLKSSYVHHR